MAIELYTNTKTFSEMFEDYNAFNTAYSNSGYPSVLTSINLIILYNLLYANFANNNITNNDEEQWQFKLFGTIWKYGPTWQKKLELQDSIRGLTESDLLAGAKAIYNHAYNPSTEPSTQVLTELTYINDQNTTNYKKSKMDAYTQLWGLLATDVTSAFIDQFKPLFKKFIAPKMYIITEEEE